MVSGSLIALIITISWQEVQSWYMHCSGCPVEEEEGVEAGGWPSRNEKWGVLARARGYTITMPTFTKSHPL
jgi:hypothetical protein